VPTPTTVVFDLGGVLIDWDPRHLYRRIFDDEAAMEAFLAEVTTSGWNSEQDAGRPWAEAIASLSDRHPDQRDRIEAFHRRWPEMLGGPIDGPVAILERLKEDGVRLFALSNWSAETFPVARRRYAFLDWFEGIVISGDVGVIKPARGIFEHLIARYGIEPSRAVFVDDSPANVKAAEDIGFAAIHFVDAPSLQDDLQRLGLLAGVKAGCLASS
jgi:2-haloacid dehalogenase